MEFYDENKKEESINVDNKEQKIEPEEVKQEKENNPEIVGEKKGQKKISKKKILIMSLVSFILLFIIIFASTAFALLNINNSKIIKGVSVNKIEVGNLTKEEAMQKIKEETESIMEKDIVIKFEEFEYSIKLSQIELDYKEEEAIEKAHSVGRNGNIFVNNYNILKSMIKGKDINLEYSYNEELLNGIIEDVNAKIPGAVVEVNYYIEDNALYISKGKPGKIIDKEKLKSEILGRVKKENNENIILELHEINPKEIDIEKIYNEVYTEPKDAYYTKEPFEVFPHVNGIDFDIEKAKELLKEDKEEYKIELIITEPKITTNKIGTEAFPDLISSFSTKYDTSNVPRTTNLKLAMQKLDGVVVSPGETFSYNKTLGKRTAEAGYKEAGGYAGGKVVQTLAGGICQISSTLYDAVVYANLDIVERHNHMFLPGYVGAGKDATVVYGALDFKFKNTRKYPIMIKTSIGGGVAKISIFGVKEEKEYDVEISTKILSYIPYNVVYEDDNTLAAGKEKVVQGGMNGCKSITYKIVRLNGKEVSRSVLSSDTYDPMNKIIKRGKVKAEEKSPEPQQQEPVEVPEPTNPPTVEEPAKPENKIEETETPAESNQENAEEIAEI